MPKTISFKEKSNNASVRIKKNNKNQYDVEFGSYNPKNKSFFLAFKIPINSKNSKKAENKARKLLRDSNYHKKNRGDYDEIKEIYRRNRNYYMDKER